jgi:hypothetical protein
MNKDKKQMLVLGALVLVIVAVGAFQFMGGKPKPAAKADEKKQDKPKDETLVAENGETVDPMKAYIDSLIAGGGGPRDPFAPQAVILDEPSDHQQPTYVKPVDPNGAQRPNEITGGEIEPWRVNVDNGQPGMGGFGGDQGNTGNGGSGVEPAPVNNGMPYALRGVMLGKNKRMCMLELADGRQVLAFEGQKLGKDLETTVVEITEQYVVLSHRGKVTNLALLGGN